MERLLQLRSILDKKKGQKLQIEKELEGMKKGLLSNKKSLHWHKEARDLIRTASLRTQDQLSYHISEVTSLALDAIFEKPYLLEAEFVQRRNKTECDLFFSRNGQQIHPMDASGGGAIDVASFALRIASWGMQTPKQRNTIILDEPFKNLSKGYQEKGSNMLKEVSKKLGIQFIIVTHENTLASFADKIFEVSLVDGISQVQAYEQEERED